MQCKRSDEALRHSFDLIQIGSVWMLLFLFGKPNGTRCNHEFLSVKSFESCKVHHVNIPSIMSLKEKIVYLP